MNLLFREATVTLLCRKQSDLVREAFTKQYSREFKDYAIREHIKDHQPENNDHNCLPVDLHTYQTHHILPVSLGGTNDFDNLSLVERQMHAYIHEILSSQTKGMLAGTTRKILIPYQTSHIWSPQ